MRADVMETHTNLTLTTTDLFKKHFGEGTMGVAGLFHPNMESFFEELNEICKAEDVLNNTNPTRSGQKLKDDE